MRSRTVQFDNDRGDRLAGVLNLQADGEVAGNAIFTNCFTCSKNLSASAHVSRALTA